MTDTYPLVAIIRACTLAGLVMSATACGSSPPDCGTPEVTALVGSLARKQIVPDLPFDEAARIDKAMSVTLKDPTAGTLSADGNDRECGGTLLVKYAEEGSAARDLAEVPVTYSLRLLADTSQFQATLKGSEPLQALKQQLARSVVLSLRQQSPPEPPPQPQAPPATGALSLFNGTWAQTQEECPDQETPTSRTFIEFTADNRGTIEGYDEVCTMLDVRPADSSVDVDLRCEHAATEARRTTSIGLVGTDAITINGEAYLRCQK